VLNPEMAQGHHNLGNLLHEQGKLDEAVACYRRAAALNPALAETHTNLGRVLQRLGKLEDAIDALRMALDLEPLSGPAFNNLGAALHGSTQARRGGSVLSPSDRAGAALFRGAQ